MTEIGAQVELSHPADRVWRALTDRELLARWFTEAEPVPGRPGQLLLYTAGLPGFDSAVDAEVTGRWEPESLVLRCHEAGRRTVLTCAVTPTAEGCRLAVRETLEHGAWPVEQRVRREESYRQALTGRLPAILDWLAFQQVDLGGHDLTATAEIPVTELGAAPAANRRSRRTALVAVLGGGALATGLAAWALLPAGSEHAAAPAPTTPPAPSAVAVGTSGPARTAPSARPTPTATRSARPSRAPSPSSSPSATPSASPSRTPSPTPSPTPALRARYETVTTRFFGYAGEVVVDNPAGTDARDWRLVVTLARGAAVVDADGAQWRQDGRSVTFTGPAVPGGRSRTIRFEVRGGDHRAAKAPEGCAVDDRPCAGL
ncbi:SRPBCC family protein [Micromonospora okii]|uniref:SRPBCC family protein n=1 Tax=Micromonospora okii TaxID=1182970 RepID=UPI001E4AD25B|nr:SRPBCC domain-containing protein [Micromonospora okii]